MLRIPTIAEIEQGRPDGTNQQYMRVAGVPRTLWRKTFEPAAPRMFGGRLCQDDDPNAEPFIIPASTDPDEAAIMRKTIARMKAMALADMPQPQPPFSSQDEAWNAWDDWRIDTLGTDAPGFALGREYGGGKSHLAAAFVSRLAGVQDCFWITDPDLLYWLRPIQTRDEHMAALLAYLTTPYRPKPGIGAWRVGRIRTLIFDDVGATAQTGSDRTWYFEQAACLVDECMNAGIRVIATTNLAWAAIANEPADGGVGGRLGDRLKRACGREALPVLRMPYEQLLSAVS